MSPSASYSFLRKGKVRDIYSTGDPHRPGISPPSFDKQFVRDYLERIRWSKQPPVPELPEDVVAGTAQKYEEAHKRLVKTD